MNTNGNLYTIIYSAIIVVLVAAILAFASVALKPKQEANQKAETIRQMLTAAKLFTPEELGSLSNEGILKKYTKNIESAFIVNSEGQKISDLNLGKENLSKIQIINVDELKVVNKAINDNKKEEIKLPVYVYNNKNGQKVTVIPIYGAGLWGPVWGYLALKEDLKTIIGAYFDHESETPGLGAKITDDPSFRAQFVGKTIDLAAPKISEIFDIIKGGNKDHKPNAIDAITGATLTSNGLHNAITTWLNAYKPFLEGKVSSASNNSCNNDSCKEDSQSDNKCNCAETGNDCSKSCSSTCKDACCQKTNNEEK